MSMRITGLASGMDIDEIVAKLMSAHRIPMTRLTQQKQLLQWKRDDYRTINSKILEFRNLMFDMKLSSTYNAKRVTSSNENAISATASSIAVPGTFKVKVTQLAEVARLTSGELAAGKTAPTNETKLGDAGLGSDTTLTISGEKGTATITVKKDDTIDGLVNAINGQSSVTGVTVFYDQTLGSFFFTSTNTGAAAKIELSSADSTLISDVFRLDTTGSGTGHYVTGAKTFASRTSEIINKDLTAKQTLLIRYGDKDYEFTIDANTTVGALIKQINSSELGKAGVSAYVDDSGRLAFFNPDKDKTITFEDATNDSVNILESLGLDTVTTSPDTSFVRVGAAGKDAKVIFNGVEGSYSTNNFQINGITFTAKKANEEVEITVVQDVDKVVENIKNFVDKYNELISLINGELTEKRYRDYAPLTDEQKKEMKDTEIEKWEQFARSGMLRNDQLLTSALSRMRAALSNAVNSMPEGFRMLADIGITTGSWEERGKLYIDETKLRKAISENPDQVAALFMTNDGVADSDAGDGIAVRMYDQLDQIFKQIVDRAGTATSVETSYSLGKELSDLDDRIEAMQRRLDELQKRYYRQFTAMETYINQMNQQSLWLAQQFGYGM